MYENKGTTYHKESAKFDHNIHEEQVLKTRFT